MIYNRKRIDGQRFQRFYRTVPLSLATDQKTTKVGQCVSVTDLDNSSKDPNPVRMLLCYNLERYYRLGCHFSPTTLALTFPRPLPAPCLNNLQRTPSRSTRMPRPRASLHLAKSGSTLVSLGRPDRCGGFADIGSYRHSIPSARRRRRRSIWNRLLSLA